MEFIPFRIEVEGPNGPELLVVLEKVIANGDHIFAVAAEENKGAGQMGWQVELSLQELLWIQTPQSLQTGPTLPCFYVEEIGGQITSKINAD